MKQTLSTYKQKKILILAADCNPEWHSLPALVFKYVIELSQHVEITLVTQIRNKANIDKLILQNIDIVYIDTEKVAAPIYKLSNIFTGGPNSGLTTKVAFRYPSYIYFEWVVWRRFKKDINAEKFDIVHRMSPMSPTIPCPIAKWNKTIPTIIGPLLSSPAWPKEYKSEKMGKREWLYYFRDFHRILPYYRSTYKNSAAILAGYPHTIADLPKAVLPRVIDFSEGGVDPEEFPMPNKIIHKKITILFVGRLVPYKLPEVLIHSFISSLFLQQHKLVFVGDGPERLRLEKLVEDNNLSHCIEFTGTISQKEVGEIMRNSEIFAFPSIREQGGGVITLAAMSCMALVVVDYGGPSYRVPNGTGIRIPMDNKEGLIISFCSALEDLIKNPEKILLFGKAARKFTEEHYSWSVKVKNTIKIYDWVLGIEEDKPVFRK